MGWTAVRKLLSIIEASLDAKYSQLFNADETAAQEITLDTEGRKVLAIYASATAATNFTLDVSNDGQNWITNYKSWSAVTSVNETINNGFRHVKFKSSAAGAAGDTVTLVLAAK